MQRSVSNSKLREQCHSAKWSRKTERGGTLVEAALVYGFVLLPLLMGVMGFGHALYAYHFVNHAAKQASRWAAVNGYPCSNDGTCTYTTGASASAVQTFATNQLPTGLNPSNVSATATWPTQTGGPTACATAATQNSKGCTVQVTVAYAYNFIFPLLPRISSTTAPCTQPGFCLSSTSTMVVNH
jgi:Flp pilus assembly protein TadG